MIYRRLTPTGDYTFGHQQWDYLADREAVGQAVQTRLKLLLGEWWADMADGLPLFQQILRQRNTAEGRQVIDLLVRERILGTPHVVAITAFKSTVNARVYQATIGLDTDYGAITETIDLGVA